MNILEIRDFSFSYPDQEKRALRYKRRYAECHLWKKRMWKEYTSPANEKRIGTAW